MEYLGCHSSKSGSWEVEVEEVFTRIRPSKGHAAAIKWGVRSQWVSDQPIFDYRHGLMSPRMPPTVHIKQSRSKYADERTCAKNHNATATRRPIAP